VVKFVSLIRLKSVLNLWTVQQEITLGSRGKKIQLFPSLLHDINLYISKMNFELIKIWSILFVNDTRPVVL
jgi:hypothetical protein